MAPKIMGNAEHSDHSSEFHLDDLLKRKKSNKRKPKNIINNTFVLRKKSDGTHKIEIHQSTYTIKIQN